MAWTPPKVLRQRVKFQRRARGTPVGGIVKDPEWSDLIPHRFAELLPVRGGEAVTAARLSGQEAFTLVVVSCTATRAVTTDDRVIDLDDPGRPFDVKSNLDLLGTRRWQVMTLERGSGDGRPGT